HVGGGAWQVGQRDFLLCPFLLAAALGVAGWAERGDRTPLVVGGLALGMGATIKPHVLILALALVLLLLLAPGRPRRERWTGAVIFAGVLTLVPLVVVAWLGANGALGPWRQI